MKYGPSLFCFFKDERGAELAEYAVGVALLVIIGLVIYKNFGDSVNDANSGTAAKITQASQSTFP
jgi:Flp pilus assembly pilin Flp